MEKAPKLKQMVVLAAGTFANVIMALLFAVIMVLFFSNTFVPAGVKFSSYGLAELSMANLTVIGNSSIQGYLELELKERPTLLKVNIGWYLSKNITNVIAYEDTPALGRK